MPKRPPLLPLALLLPLLPSPPAAARPLTPDTPYVGPETLESAEAGMRFTLPAGWTGSLPSGGPGFIAARGEGLQVILTPSPAPLTELRAELERGSQIAEGVTLTPAAPLKEGPGGALEGPFGVPGLDALKAYIIARPVKGRAPAVVVAVCTTAPLDACERAARELAQSVKPLKAAPASAAPASAAPAGAAPAGPLAAALADKRLNRFHTSSGYSERETLTLCADGRVFRSFDASSVSQLGSGAARAGGDGRWAVRGQTLSVRWASGEVSEFEVSASADSLTLNGNRWLREDVRCP